MSKPEKEALLARWSRLKRESSASDIETEAAADGGADESEENRNDEERSGDPSGQMPELPPLDSLTPESDYQGFMDPRVDDAVRRTALKTLFRSPGFNVVDGLDVYAEDYTKLGKLSPAFVATLKYAQRTLFANEKVAADQTAPGEDGGPAQAAGRTDAQVAGDEGDGGPGEQASGAGEENLQPDAVRIDHDAQPKEDDSQFERVSRGERGLSPEIGRADPESQ
jgi:hypothetical protein